MAPQPSPNSGEMKIEASNYGPSGGFPIQWPERLLGPRPGLRGITIVCWGFFFGTLVIPICFALWIRLRQTAACDFVYFYGVGSIVKNYPSARLYDLGLQLKTFNTIAPPLSGFYGPSPYPPFVAQFFSLFARLPFKVAFLMWMGASLALYLGGASLLVKEFSSQKSSARSLAICAALAFPGFIMNTLANGQISSIAFCAICFGVVLERRGSLVGSGISLSILAYKPTLLLLLFPMLLVTRRFKTLLGFAVGVTLLCLESTVFAGFKIWPSYLHFLMQFKQITEKSGTGVSPSQFVDLTSLSYGMPGGRSHFALAVLVGVAIATLLWLASLLWRSSKLGRPAQGLVWATTLTWTLLLNLYVPIYDSVLAVIGVILTIGALKELDWNKAVDWAIFSAVLIFAVAWITEPIARRSGMQPFTLVLFLFGIMQLALLGDLCRSPKSEARLNEVLAG